MHRRFTSFAAHVLVACLPVLSLVMAVGAGTASAARSPVNARAAALAALAHLKIGEHATDHPLPGQSVRVKGAKLSTNWAGYANTKTSGKYSKVTGSWTEPKGTCGSSQSLAVFWTGIDGFTSGTVEQDGTLIECNGGTPTYVSWWEMFPSNDVQFVSTAVRPGDHITSSVTRSGTKYTLKLTGLHRHGRQLQHHPDLCRRHVRRLERRVDRRGADRLLGHRAAHELRRLDADGCHRAGRAASPGRSRRSRTRRSPWSTTAAG